MQELQRMDANKPAPNNRSEDPRINDKRYDCDGGHLNHDHGNVISTHKLLNLISFHTNSCDFFSNSNVAPSFIFIGIIIIP